jgi:hypothetical protein
MTLLLNHHASSPAFAAATGPSPISFTEALLLVAVAALLVATFQLRRVARRLSLLEERLGPAPLAPASAAPPIPAGAAATVGEVEPRLPAEIQAVIAAAIHVTLGHSAQVVAITEGVESTHVWSLEGRRQIFASHQLR